jgi:hypothetical protein
MVRFLIPVPDAKVKGVMVAYCLEKGKSELEQMMDGA